MELDKLNKLNKLFNKVSDIIPKLTKDQELHLLNEIGVASDDQPSMMSVLGIVGAIRTTQGTPRVYYEVGNQDDTFRKLDSFKGLIKNIIDRLESAPDNALAKSEVVSMLEDSEFSAEDYYPLVSLLSHMDIATSAGKGSAGGIQLYEPKADAIKVRRAETEIQKEQTIKERTNKEKEKEEVLYPSAAKLVTELGFQAITLGVKHHFAGEWNTPDIVGYKIKHLNVLGGVEVEVITVEVKWTMSKAAIAEANSHQRLSHRSYLMVHQDLESIEPVYLTDLQEKGIGLICLKNGKPIAHSIAKLSTALRSDIDTFLSKALTDQNKESIKDEMARHLFADTFYRML